VSSRLAWTWTKAKKAVTLTAELPGVTEKDIDVSLVGDQLTIKGEKRSEHEEKKEMEGHVVHRTERSYGAFQRTITVPYKGPILNQVSADVKDGVLRIYAAEATRCHCSEGRSKNRSQQVEPGALVVEDRLQPSRPIDHCETVPERGFLGQKSEITVPTFTLLHYAIVFLVVALIAAAVGFGGVAGVAMEGAAGCCSGSSSSCSRFRSSRAWSAEVKSPHAVSAGDG